MGVQSASSKSLSMLKRNHSLDHVWEALETLQSSFDMSRVSLDFLIGIPNEDFKSLDENLEIISKYNPGHVSFYILTPEKNTLFYDQISAKKLRYPPSEDIADKYRYIQRGLTDDLGFSQYEISNYQGRRESELLENGMKMDNRSRHNRMYWEGDVEYFAFGMGSASLLNGRRFQRPRNLKKYFEFVDEIQLNADFGKRGELELDTLNNSLKTLFIGKLRTLEGISLLRIKEYLNSMFVINELEG